MGKTTLFAPCVPNCKIVSYTTKKLLSHIRAPLEFQRKLTRSHFFMRTLYAHIKCIYNFQDKIKCFLEDQSLSAVKNIECFTLSIII
jgi:hypothetical protein